MQSSRREILCLCHDATVLLLRQLLLEHFGYKVLSTSSVEDATSIAQDCCPDMLLMDHDYPGVSTEHVAAQVKQVCPKLIAVVLSPYFAVRDSSHTAVDRFVPGDGEPDALIEQIEELFESKGRDGHRPGPSPM